jgi:hypothetical protein
MIKYLLEKYTLQIHDKADGTCSLSLKSAEEKSESYALKKERRKIYLISSLRKILYVGEADTSMKTRLQRGCIPYNYFIKNKIAQNGYYGYKWLNKNNNPERLLTLSVAIFEPEHDPKENRNIIEAIEGELVYLIRQNTGEWPYFQQEIHFSNVSGAEETALNIYHELFD